MEDLSLKYSPEELEVINIQFLGLKQKAWEFSRGARTQRIYEYPDTEQTAIKDFYSYTYSDNGRDVLTITRTLKWFDKEGNIFLEKDISPDLNIKNIKNINREIRQGRIDYMEAAAEELATLAPFVPEPYKSDFKKASSSIDILMKHYEIEINHYIQRGTQEFEDAIRAETNPIMLNILSLNVRPPDTLFASGLNVHQTIIHQLTGEYNP